MEIVLVFIILGIAAMAYFLWKSKQKQKKEELPDPGAEELHLENVQAGGLIRLINVGENMDEYDITITARHIYRSDDSEWYELEGDSGTDKVWVSLEEDDGLDVSLTLRKIKFRELDITRDELDDMDEKGKGKFVFEGKTYHYDSSQEASLFTNGNVSESNEEVFYYWEFEAEDEETYITIEEWRDKSIEVSLAQPLKESQVQVYSLGK